MLCSCNVPILNQWVQYTLINNYNYKKIKPLLQLLRYSITIIVNGCSTLTRCFILLACILGNITSIPLADVASFSKVEGQDGNVIIAVVRNEG